MVFVRDVVKVLNCNTIPFLNFLIWSLCYIYLSGSFSVTSLGCYQDRVTNPSQRVFSTVFLQVNIVRWWPDSNHIIQACAAAALARGYRIFSIQDFGDCRWGPNAERDYAKYGLGWYCYRGLGWIGSGTVYRVRNSARG